MKILTNDEIERLVTDAQTAIDKYVNNYNTPFVHDSITTKAYDWIIRDIRKCNELSEKYILGDLYYWSCSSNYFDPICALLETYEQRLK